MEATKVRLEAVAYLPGTDGSRVCVLGVRTRVRAEDRATGGAAEIVRLTNAECKADQNRA